LLAIGSERYVPYRPRTAPEELLTQANAILGFGQMSLAKVVMICAREDAPQLDVQDIPAVFAHVLARIDFRRDLHFQTRTTIDTLDYSGEGFNRGSKLVMAAVGEPIRPLETQLPSALPEGFSDPRVAMPGVLLVKGPAYQRADLRRFCAAFSAQDAIARFALIVLVDDSEFAARTLNNFLWVTFTRMNPALDTDGIGAFSEDKHWGCSGSFVIDARKKPHHAPPLVEDPEVTRRVDALGAAGGPLAGLW
jgi:4-hydroxy-3-polyprenylbenzoate decarboxylase